MSTQRTRWVGVIALVALLAGAGLAGADLPIPVFRNRPLILHLEGTMAADRTTAARTGFTTVSFDVVGREPAQRYWLGVDKVYPLGDYPRLGKDILDDLYMYDPTFFVVGPPDLVTQFVNVAPDARVVLEALANGTSRTFYLRRVGVADDR
jgi:hypothetical protein